MEWVVPKTPIYYLDRSGDILADMVLALRALVEKIRREFES